MTLIGPFSFNVDFRHGKTKPLASDNYSTRSYKCKIKRELSEILPIGVKEVTTHNGENVKRMG